MIDFYNNTYYLRPEEFDEAIEILKKHPEYKGMWGLREFYDGKTNLDDYDSLWEYIDDCRTGNNIYMDNEYITSKMIQQNPNIVKLAEVYDLSRYAQHDPQPLLPLLRLLDKQVLTFE